MKRDSHLTSPFVSTVFRGLTVCMSVQCMLAADASTVTLDWSARTTGQQACIMPAASGSTSATLALLNSNIILYAYSLNVKSYQLPSNDAPAILTAATNVAARRPKPDCASFATNIKKYWTNPSLFPMNRQSVPLDETEAALASQESSVLASDILEVTNDKDACRGQLTDKTLLPGVDPVANNMPVYQQKFIALQANSALSSIQFHYQVDATHYDVFRLTEQARWNGNFTNATLTWRCGLDDVLTLSVGAMGATLPYRTYVSQSVPEGLAGRGAMRAEAESALGNQIRG